MSSKVIHYDPVRALTEPWRDYFLEHRDHLFSLPCEEGSVEIRGRRMLLTIMLCMPLIKRYRPISRDKHLLLEGIYDATSHAKVMTQVSRTLESYGYTREELGHDIIQTVMNAHNMCYSHLGGHILGMDIFGLADTVLQSGAKDVCTMDYGNIEDGNINRMETAFKEQCQKVDALFSGDTLPINVFKAPLACGALKRGQFYQFVLSAGPRTDTDDHVFKRPVVGSFLSGMCDIQDLTLESRAAAKATHYNKSQMAKTQYGNRKIHIQNSAIWHLYPGDCGTSVTLTYRPNKKTWRFYMGKFFLDPHAPKGQGQLIELTEANHQMVLGQDIEFRDVQGCKWTDGYCETCGGTITKSFSKDGNVGFLSNVNTGAPVAQQVLSTKHLTSTDAAEYVIPQEFVDTLMSITNDIFLRPPVRKIKDRLCFGFVPRDISKINDLKYHLSENDLHAAYFSDIKYMYIGLMKEDGTIERHSNRTAMGGDTKTYPHLSTEVLNIIRQNPEDLIIQDKLAWFCLRNVDIDKPVMQCTVVNNSIKRFVQQFTDLVTKDIEKYVSMNHLMRDLSHLIWERVGTHITHISCLAKACMITSKTDFHVPEMHDPEKVMFGSLNRIIPMRSIGGLYAFERIDIATNKPQTYITVKQSGIFDEFLGFQDVIERDDQWPIPTGSPVAEEPMDFVNETDMVYE